MTINSCSSILINALTIFFKNSINPIFVQFWLHFAHFSANQNFSENSVLTSFSFFPILGSHYCVKFEKKLMKAFLRLLVIAGPTDS